MEAVGKSSVVFQIPLLIHINAAWNTYYQACNALVDFSKGDAMSGAEVRSMLTKYVKDNELVHQTERRYESCMS